ncbi:alpha-L-rhamnosidase C-terminal domain-containing protein [Pedobacter sp. KACC 23697]|uniref:Alpha-L-rhamnosidase C-terminal domain-containing protein n=1 Tax=Pedobacter sp. KACC 23697 TaxID=3149230 RepID=A0AAU7KBK4_9SPHI
MKKHQITLGMTNFKLKPCICYISICFLFFIKVQSSFAQDKSMVGYWISPALKEVNKANRWIAFRRDLILKEKPEQALTTIAADTKYWLWINGKLIIFEGGLKRGPNPKDTYADKVNLAPYLKKGKNKIAILLWYFGKDGFSHIGSGLAGLYFKMNVGNTMLNSDMNWSCRIHPAYGDTEAPFPNYRLPESNIRFDARKDMTNWQTMPITALADFSHAVPIGQPGGAPWNKLVERPIPQWKDFGIRAAKFYRLRGNLTDTIIAKLPYNMQLTPIISVKDDIGGRLIKINTDHSKSGGTDNLRAEYITKKGIQEYESYGWLNGEKIILVVPKAVKVTAIKYRETGYNAEPSGAFTSSDEFYNRFWKKAQRTLYVNMRDNYFDCPDRERAQWWGDAVLLMGESFYTYSISTHALMRKAISELAAWQRPSGELFAPVPGNFNQELPDQMLTSIGYYGFWNYYINTGDRKTIEAVYPAIKRYLALWKTDNNGLTLLRKGDWLWGDWGDNIDVKLIMAGWHYLALDGASRMADMLGYAKDAAMYRQTMNNVKIGYNKCWDGHAYRHPSYTKQTDDRVQALAVISGIADSSKYRDISQLLHTQMHASPYMEKYVMEALFKMGAGKYAMERTKQRFAEMVNNPYYTTLFEGWGIGENGFGGGTTNHAWSGGAQIVIAQYLFGIRPLEAGYKTFLIEPDPANLRTGTLNVPTVKGMINTSFENNMNGFKLQVTVPPATTAIVRLPAGAKVFVNKNLPETKELEVAGLTKKTNTITFKLSPGKYKIKRQQPL